MRTARSSSRPGGSLHQATPPPEQTPRDQAPPGTHTLQSRHAPWEQTPPEQTPPGSRHPPRSRPPLGADTSPVNRIIDTCKNIAFLQLCLRVVTRKYSSRMCTAHLPTICVSVATTRCQYWWRVGPQLNKFEQVSSDDHQMSVAGEGISPMSGVCGWG